MKYTLQLKLFPNHEQAKAMLETMETFNRAANWLAERVYGMRSANKMRLQKLHYADLRNEFGLPAQMSLRCIVMVSETFKKNKKVKPHFEQHGPIPFDPRLLSIKALDSLSVLTLSGRIVMPFVIRNYDDTPISSIKGLSVLSKKGDQWFLSAMVDLPESPREL